MENKEVADLLNNSCDLVAKGAFEGAHKILYRVLMIEPDNKEELTTAGLSLVNLERFEEAAKCFERVVKLDDNDANSWFYLGCCEEKNDNVKKAEKAYKKVLSLRPEYYDAYKSLGVL